MAVVETGGQTYKAEIDKRRDRQMYQQRDRQTAEWKNKKIRLTDRPN